MITQSALASHLRFGHDRECSEVEISALPAASRPMIAWAGGIGIYGSVTSTWISITGWASAAPEDRVRACTRRSP